MRLGFGAVMISNTLSLTLGWPLRATPTIILETSHSILHAGNFELACRGEGFGINGTEFPVP